MAGRRRRWRRCIWLSRRRWRPAILSTNPGLCLSNERPGLARPRPCWADVAPSRRWCRQRWHRKPRPPGSPTPGGSHRQPTTSWPSWSTAAPPGRCGTSGPKRNGRSASSTCPLTVPRRWWICWSLRSSIVGVLRWPHRLTTSRNRRCCGGRRVVRLHCRRRRPLHLAADPRRRAASPHCCRTARRWVRRADGGGSGRARTGGERHRTRCRAGRIGPPDVHLGCPAAARDRPRRRRENHSYARPHDGLDRGRWPRDRPGPVGCCGRRPCRANRYPHRHPRQTHLVFAARRPAQLGRQRSDRRHW